MVSSMYMYEREDGEDSSRNPAMAAAFASFRTTTTFATAAAVAAMLVVVAATSRLALYSPAGSTSKANSSRQDQKHESIRAG